jgi:transposase InsO family protein
MSVKLTAAVVAVAEGSGVNVSAVCRDAGVSRKTFYKWVARYRAEGLDGLQDRSRRPVRTPHRLSAGVEDEVVRLRKELADAGLDHGASTIQWHLGRRRSGRVPSVATVHRVLVRRGLIEPAPKKRPKSSWKRFEAPAPNERWQIDAMDWTIATGVVRVFNVIDDHSRVLTASRAVIEATSEEAWATFSGAAAIWGFPAGALSDNGLCFSGKLHGFEVFFETQLHLVGVRTSTGRPRHPQTTGKVERVQQTIKKWLRRQRLARNLAELQAQLDAFVRIYNHERPHQGIGRQIPIQRWAATQRATPGEPIPAAGRDEHRHDSIVDQRGVANGGEFQIHIGVEHHGRAALTIVSGIHAVVFIDGTLIRHLELNPNRRYQPSGRPRGGPPRARLQS